MIALSCLELRVLIFILTIFFCDVAWSQSSASTDVRDSYIEEYEGEDLVIFNWERDFTFSYNPASGLMEVDESFEMKYLNISSSIQTPIYPIFVDDYSAIRSIRSGGSKRKADPFPYEIDGIFYHDSKVNPVMTYVEPSTTLSSLYFLKEYSDSKYLTRKYLGSQYPVHEFTLRLKFPNYSEVDAILFNAEKFDIERKEYEQGIYKVIEFTGSDLPAFKHEEYSKGAAFYAPHILILTKGVTINGEDRNLMSTTADLYSWYSSLVKEIGNDSDELDSFVEDLVEQCEDEQCEMETIFYWIQDKIRYIAFEDGIAGFRPEACQDVFFNRYGDCKGMANLMTEMLKSRDIDARLTWVGTQSVPYDYSIPSLSVDNHMICTVVREDGSYLFLDGTEKFIAFNDIAERIQGRPVMIEDGQSYILEKVPSFSHLRNKEILEVIYEVDDDLLIGEFNYTVKGEGKVRMMNRYADVPTKDKSEAKRLFFSRGITDITIGDGSYTDLEDRGEEIKWSAPFEAKNRVDLFGSALYLDWDIYRTYAKSLFKDDELDDIKGDMDFRSKVYDIEHYTIAPIAGFKLKDLPKNFSVEEEDFILAVDFRAVEDGTVHIKKEIIIPNASIPNDKLKLWNESLRRLEKEAYESPIIYEKQ